MRQTFFEHAKSITGVVLLGFGIFIFHENLDQAATQLNQFLSSVPGEVVPTVILAAWRVWQAYAADHQRFLLGLVQHVWVLSWPLLLVMAGTVMSRDAFTDKTDTDPKKDSGLVASKYFQN